MHPIKPIVGSSTPNFGDNQYREKVGLLLRILMGRQVPRLDPHVL